MNRIYKAPTLYQLNSQYGNLTLKPESAKGWDVGVEQRLWKSETTASVEATYFRQVTQNMIDYEFSSNRYQNIAETVSFGMESALKFEWADFYSIRSSYTYLNSTDRPHRAPLLRRPKHRGKLTFNYGALEDRLENPWSGFFDIVVVGSREDLGFTTARQRMPGYFLLNTGASRVLSNVFEAGARIENILGRKYEEVAGYGTSGFTVFGYIEAKL